MGIFDKPKQRKYKKLVKHKRKPNKQRSAFSSNSYKVVHNYSDGAEKRQSHLSGKTYTVTKRGREIKNRKY